MANLSINATIRLRATVCILVSSYLTLTIKLFERNQYVWLLSVYV